MNRRRVLLIVAAFVVLLGTGLVYLYVRGADSRAASKYQTVQVLKATAPIAAGESIDAAAAAGKLAIGPVVRTDLLANVQTSTENIKGEVALAPIFPGEQITSDKFGTKPATDVSSLQIPKGDIAASINLGDPDRVAGFVEPGSQVAIFYTGTVSGGASGTQLLLGGVSVLGVGSTTVTTTTTTTTDGQQTTESLPRTLLTLALTKSEAQKIIYASKNGALTFGLMTTTSIVRPGPATTGQNLFK